MKKTYHHDLRERVKELNCLYSISRLAVNRTLSLDDILNRVVEIIPPAWQYPDITCARITLGPDVYATPGFRDSEIKLSSKIPLSGGEIGYLEVVLLREDGDISNCFLEEEVRLFNAVVEQLQALLEFKCNEKKLLCSEEHFRTLIDNVTDLIAIWELDGTILYMSPSAPKIIGAKPDYLLGRNFLEMVDPGDVGSLKAVIAKAISSKEGPEYLEFRLCRVDRVWLTMGTYVKRYCGPVGSNCVITTSRDISEQKRVQAKIRTAHEELKLSYRELASTQTKLIKSAKLASIGKMSARVAHEINNPLEAIKSRVQLLQDQIPARLDLDLISKDLAMIDGQVNRIAAIVRNLLDFSRMPVRSFSTVRLQDVLLNVVNLKEYSLRARGIELKTKIDNSIPGLKADPEGLQQIFMNLIRNAREAMNKGGTLLISLYFLNPNRIVVEFRDTGEGIQSEAKTRLFEPFYTTKKNGTGLGLPICLHIVEQHGGTLIYENNKPKGTVARLEFPLPTTKK